MVQCLWALLNFFYPTKQKAERTEWLNSITVLFRLKKSVVQGGRMGCFRILRN